MALNFCSECGAQVLSATAHFCNQCGHPFPPPAAAPIITAPATADNALFGNIGDNFGNIAATTFSQASTNTFERIRHPQGHEVIIGGCRKDRPDNNDRHYTRHQESNAAEMPAFVDLRRHMTEIENQGDLGSCTANAIAGAYEYLAKRITGNDYRISRLFIYYMERELEGTVDEDNGAEIRDGMKVLRNYGACNENIWPYDASAFRDRPHQQAFDDAQQHTIDEYHRVPIDLDAMRSCVAEGYPFVFGMQIYKSFEEASSDGRIQLPQQGEKCLGGHAMLVCGYSDNDRVFVVRNSWGPTWGDKGYCYVPYDYLAHSDYTDDCWTLRRAHNLDFSQDLDIDRSGTRSFFSEFVAAAVTSVAASMLDPNSNQAGLGGIVGNILKSAFTGNENEFERETRVNQESGFSAPSIFNVVSEVIETDGGQYEEEPRGDDTDNY